MSLIVGGTLFLLGAIAIGSVVALFDLSSWTWIEKLYGNWAITACALITPLYALIHLPDIGDIDHKKYEINRFFTFLIRYVATPAIYIYFAILYAYSVRVLMYFSDWPKGMITWLVVGFSSFGYLVYIFSRPYEDSRLVSVFRRYFPYIVIPQIAMLAYAIGLRITQYDFTMNRYFVVVFGLWLFIISLYMIMSKRRSLIMIPLSLSFISLLISIGPWSVFSYPQGRQEARLMRNLETAKILQSGKIVPLKSERDISKELSTEIAGGIEYLCSFDDCARIRDIFPEQTVRAEQTARAEWEKYNTNTWSKYTGTSYWQIQTTIMTELRVQRYPYDDMKREFTESEYLTYTVDYQKSQYPLDVKGYDRVLQVVNENETKYNTPSYPYMTINTDTMKASLVSASGVTRTYALILSENLLDSATLSQVTADKLTFTLMDDRYEIRLFLQSLTVKNPRYAPSADSQMSNINDKMNIAYIWGATGLALIKEKK